MGRRNKGGKLPPFVPIMWDVLNSKAYKHLPPSSAKALPYFIGKVKLTPYHPEYHSQHIRFPYREAKVLGFSSGTFSAIIRNLVSYGFLDPVERGGMKPYGYGVSVFKLSPRWRYYGTADFHKTEWFEILPKLKLLPTSKSEMDSFKIRTNGGENHDDFSQIEAVRH